MLAPLPTYFISQAVQRSLSVDKAFVSLTAIRWLEKFVSTSL